MTDEPLAHLTADGRGHSLRTHLQAVLQRALRDRPDRAGAQAICDAIDHIARVAPSLLASSDTDVVRGIEGDSAAWYFGVFDHLILSEKTSFTFSGRTRRPSRDPDNAMLSFGYALLLNDCLAAATAAGLDAAVGFLHWSDHETPRRSRCAIPPHDGRLTVDDWSVPSRSTSGDHRFAPRGIFVMFCRALRWARSPLSSESGVD